MKRYLVHNGRSELTSCLMRVGGWGQGGGGGGGGGGAGEPKKRGGWIQLKDVFKYFETI